MSIYRSVLEVNISKLLNLYNLDPLSQTIGYGDRLFWAWKIIDFPNATLQGGVHSLAIALKLGLVKNEDQIMGIIDSIILAIDRMKARNGSLVEAYPNEQSFCVTALVAFDVLSTIDLLSEKLDPKIRDKYLNVVKPLIHFIEKHDEEHAIISNHLATAVAAIAIWNKLSGHRSNRHNELLDVIYSHQSEEGWYKEYEGADVGYQTLCTYYLAVANEYLCDDKLKFSIDRSLEYLKYFVHPDGSIGGLYGSRNTEVFYPGGLAILAKKSNLAAAILKQLESGITKEVHLLPQNIDIGNYIPLLNSYAYAALMTDQSITNRDLSILPINHIFEKQFNHSGIYIHSNEKYYAIINFKKGGTLKVFDKEKMILDVEDGGWISENVGGKWVSTQQFDVGITFENKELETGFYKNLESYPSIFQFVVLRLFSMTIFKSNKLGTIFKKYVVKMLMTGKDKTDGKVMRKFEFLPDSLNIYEEVTSPSKFTNSKLGGKFKAIHMASSGYNTRQMMNNVGQPKFVANHTSNES